MLLDHQRILRLPNKGLIGSMPISRHSMPRFWTSRKNKRNIGIKNFYPKSDFARNQLMPLFHDSDFDPQAQKTLSPPWWLYIQTYFIGGFQNLPLFFLMTGKSCLTPPTPQINWTWFMDVPIWLIFYVSIHLEKYPCFLKGVRSVMQGNDYDK